MQKGRLYSFRAFLRPPSDVLPGLKDVIFSLIYLLPAFFYGCSDRQAPADPLSGRTVVTKIYLADEDAPKIRCLDIFFFNDDRLMRLDSYQRIENPSLNGGELDASSRDGKKILVLLANSSDDRYGWSEINSYAGLGEIMSELGNDDPAFPVMSCEYRLKAGYDKSCISSLRPLMGKIHIASLSCDFHGTAYEGAALENVKIYLTNVSSRSPILNPDSTAARAFINSGRLVRTDLESFSSPGMIFQELSSPVGIGIIKSGVSLYCYPNDPGEEGIGTPRTRLVIEGQIDGRTYYYPLEAGREGGGIHSGESYRYDITITRRGTDSPETLANSGLMVVKNLVQEWEECDGIKITY